MKLHLFPTQHTARSALITSRLVGERNLARQSIATDKGEVLFKVVADMNDAQSLSGLHFTEVTWHHTPALEVAVFINSRIRS